jgi:c-di-AMP phosphodiesterase-like protein
MKLFINKYRVHLIVLGVVLILIAIFSLFNSTNKNYKKIDGLQKKINKLEREAIKNEALADYEKEMRVVLTDSLKAIRGNFKLLNDELNRIKKKRPAPQKLSQSELQKWYDTKAKDYTKLRKD